MAEAKKKDSRLERAGVSGYNKPKRTPGHAKKSHVVVAKVGDQIKTIRFGEQGASKALRLDTARTLLRVNFQQPTGQIRQSGNGCC